MSTLNFRPVKLCRKKLHLLTPENISVSRGSPFKKCRACYNQRLKLYMRGYRKKMKSLPIECKNAG